MIGMRAGVRPARPLRIDLVQGACSLAGWDGGAVSAVTTEYRQGLALKISARFRAYADYAEAFTDYARLLKRRYQGVVEAGSDALAFVRGLANGGYATDPAYAAKLRGVIRSVEAAGA